MSPAWIGAVAAVIGLIATAFWRMWKEDRDQGERIRALEILMMEAEDEIRELKRVPRVFGGGGF